MFKVGQLLLDSRASYARKETAGREFVEKSSWLHVIVQTRYTLRFITITMLILMESLISCISYCLAQARLVRNASRSPPKARNSTNTLAPLRRRCFRGASGTTLHHVVHARLLNALQYKLPYHLITSNLLFRTAKSFSLPRISLWRLNPSDSRVG